MLEEFILNKMSMNGELIRITLAIIGTGAATWFDVKNNKNVPNNLLYGFLAVALLTNLVFFQQDVFVYGIGVSLAIFAIGHIFYKLGYIGGADVYVMTSIGLLLPVFPSYISMPFNFPPVLSIVITSGILFSLYVLAFLFANVILKGEKGKYEYLILVPAYAILLYFISSTGMFGVGYMVAMGILILSSVLFMVYREAMTRAMAKKIPLSKADEEDLAAVELMPELVKKYSVKRLLDAKELARLKKLKVKEIYVYTDLPPFLPFVLAGLVVSVIVGDILVYSMNIG